MKKVFEVKMLGYSSTFGYNGNPWSNFKKMTWQEIVDRFGKCTYKSKVQSQVRNLKEDGEKWKYDFYYYDFVDGDLEYSLKIKKQEEKMKKYKYEDIKNLVEKAYQDLDQFQPNVNVDLIFFTDGTVDTYEYTGNVSHNSQKVVAVKKIMSTNDDWSHLFDYSYLQELGERELMTQAKDEIITEVVENVREFMEDNKLELI
jgi:hypothetical protein